MKRLSTEARLEQDRLDDIKREELRTGIVNKLSAMDLPNSKLTIKQMEQITNILKRY